MSTKRIIAGLVALLMTLAVLPAAVFADSLLGEYAPITTMEELVEGDYVIYNERDTYSGIMNNTFASGRFKASTPTFSGSNIVVTDESVVWHIAYVEGSGYTVYNAAAAKYAEIVTNSTSGFAFNNEPTMYYTVELNEDGTFDIYNANVNNRGICLYQTDYRPYTVDGTNYNPVHLYKLGGGAVSDACAAPAATPTSGTVLYGQAISLICTTADSTVYYSIDDGDTYNVYSGPFYLTSSTTVYAYASAPGMSDSAVVTFDYVVEDEVTPVTIAAAKELENNTYAKVTGIVTFIDGKNVYVEDATGALCLYFQYADDPTLAQLSLGDSVTALGKKTVYHGLVELSNVIGGNPFWVTVNSTGNALPVQNVTLAQIAADPEAYHCERVYVENVELGEINYSGNTPVSDGENTINAYKLPELTGIDSFDFVNMYAVIGWYDAPQFRVQYAADVTLAAAMQTLTVNYQYEDGTEAAPSFVQGYAQGASYSVVSPEITGFIPSVAVVEGVMGSEDVTVTVTYVQDVTIPTYTLTVNYQYEDGTAAAEAYTAELYEGDTYSVESPAIEGYTVDQLVVSGVMPAHNVTVTVTYTAIAPAEETMFVPVTDATQLVEGKQYIFVGVNEDAYYAMGWQRNNNRLAVAVTPVDGAIVVTPSVLASDDTSVFAFTLGYDAELGGYTFLDAITGGYLYAAGSNANYLRTQAVNDVNGAWTIAFEDGVTSVIASGSSNRNVMQYNSTSTIFACYATASQKPVYLYVESDGVIPEPTYHTLTVNYQYEDGTEAAPAYVADFAEGAGYSIQSPVIPGYTADIEAVEGVMGVEDVTVTVTYTANPVVEGATYRIVTDASQLVEGKQYIIVGSDGDVRYMMGYQRNNNRGAVQVTVNADGTITAAPAVLADDQTAPFEFTLGYDTELAGYTFYDAVTGGYLYAAGSGSNYLRTQAENDVNGVWTITFPGDDVASIVAEGSSNRNVMQYNSGSNIFACYATASQKAVYIYEKVEGVDPQPQVLYGDVNCDGEIGFADVSLLAQYIAGQAELSEQGILNADMDRDGEVGFSDVGAIYQFCIG